MGLGWAGLDVQVVHSHGCWLHVRQGLSTRAPQFANTEPLRVTWGSHSMTAGFQRSIPSMWKQKLPVPKGPALEVIQHYFRHIPWVKQMQAWP